MKLHKGKADGDKELLEFPKPVTGFTTRLLRKEETIQSFTGCPPCLLSYVLPLLLSHCVSHVALLKILFHAIPFYFESLSAPSTPSSCDFTSISPRLSSRSSFFFNFSCSSSRQRCIIGTFVFSPARNSVDWTNRCKRSPQDTVQLIIRWRRRTTRRNCILVSKMSKFRVSKLYLDEFSWTKSKERKASPFGSPSIPLARRFWSSLIRCFARETSSDTKSWLHLRRDAYTRTRRKYRERLEGRARAGCTRTMYKRGKEGTTPWREPVTSRQSSRYLYIVASRMILFSAGLGAITFQDRTKLTVQIFRGFTSRPMSAYLSIVEIFQTRDKMTLRFAKW